MLSFRRRLALVHLAVIVSVLALAGFAGYWSLYRAVHGQLDAALLALAESETAMLAESSPQPIAIHEMPAGSSPPSFARLDRLLQIIDADGRVLARSANLGSMRLPATPALLERLAAGETVFETLPDFGEEPIRMVSVPVQVHGTRLAIQVAGSLDDVNKVMRSASLLFIGMGLALILAVGTAGAVLTRRVFRTIDEVVRQARHIGEASLSERLRHPGTQDEMGRLVGTLNEMLDRLEQSFEIQRRFTSDASHELRSPLSRLRTELEVTLRRPRESAEYEETLRSCLEEVERLTLLVEELLTLARLDADQQRDPLEPILLNTVIEETVRRLEPVALGRKVELVFEVSPPVTARISQGALGLVLANLLDNAVKFSPSGGQVRIRLATGHTEAIITVCDQGPGLCIEELPHVFERFFRGTTARANGTPGVGLGLALAQAIVHAHRGRILASNRPEGGAKFVIGLPLAN
jgi:two-component system OmpR family sensor kinase